MRHYTHNESYQAFPLGAPMRIAAVYRMLLGVFSLFREAYRQEPFVEALGYELDCLILKVAPLASTFISLAFWVAEKGISTCVCDCDVWNDASRCTMRVPILQGRKPRFIFGLLSTLARHSSPMPTRPIFVRGRPYLNPNQPRIPRDPSTVWA